MRYIVSPQLVLQVGKGQEVERALYLTPYDYIDEKSPIYYFLRSHLNIQRPEIVKRHILLTLRMTQLKGYLGNLLDIKDDIIIYSHKNNLEYSYVDNTIFNPFVYTQKKTLLKNDSFLYNVYSGACDFLVIWVARACDTSIPEFGSYEDVDNNIIKFETMLMEVFPQLDLDITVESKFNNIFRTNLKLTGLKKIIQRVQDLDINYKSLLSRYDEHFINMTGNHFILNDEQLNLSIWDLDSTLALSSDGDTVMINNVKLFTDLVSDIDTQMERIKGDITYKVHLATPINSRIKLDIETSFIFIETATNNILLSSDKKISIILAKNHISIKVKNHIPNIEKYFTFLVIAINAMFNSVQKSSDFTKVETVYWSRICQNTKNKNRKPIIINYLDPGMKKISNNFYRSDEKEVFINDNGIMFTCIDPLGKYNKVGFLNIFHDMRKYCIPCCFLHDQSHRSTFSSCVHQIDVEKKIVSPYILNFGKVVTESKMSFLPIIFDAFLNDGMTANMEQDNKRLKETSGYHIVRCCAGDDIVRLRTISDIIQFVNEDKNILIVNDMIYFPMNATDIGKKIHILIQEIVHEVMIVKKKESSDKIDFFPPNYKLLKDLFPKQTIQTPIHSDAGMVLTTDGFYIDGKLFNEDLSSKYVTFTKNVIASDAVTKYFSPLFKYVISEAKDRFIKTWMINIMIHMNVDPNNIIPTLEKYYPNSGRAQIN
ncbi:Early transcription factor 82 kDa subunit [Monkeypox virus]|uniref:Early transcription factor 82 kDa subunit n=2 Tax=Monkeypox virus TaxID=10244 RepID=ETF2_MONPV|nr:Early transcription factor 82 kDa subunit [Monkeypox virus]A0A7H0DNA5.1 RecName: Full=Early transcription factor 82 kDa subunit; AltName: Full=ETF large subunit [Monkeypox virus]AAU01322.1 MPXV-WRAIR112 [Monkeypox virus]AAW67870.1 MPXV-SL-112 [Monkeypox virus]AAX09213.1 MPXV-COP-112 [Monkeypox virus]AAY96917.1 82kDa large subunit of early gene transcription factor VETF [Monkeypox virus]AAY97516.1 82kDa large subunit of early gene transcription factor VETF [Monkeypox virus]